MHSPTQLPFFCMLIWLGIQPTTGAGDESTVKTVEISSAIVKLIDNVEVAAESSGVIEKTKFQGR